MFKFYIQALLLCNASHMHQTRTIGASDESRTSFHVPLYLVKSHLRTDSCFFDGEHTTKTTALIRTLWLQHLDSLHQIQQILDLVEWSHVLLTR